MSTGLVALLDDVVGLAKIAAASMDDVAAQAAKAGTKAAGVVIDDAAVTPRYMVGVAAQRELSMVAKIALGSIKNKLVYLLPLALALNWLAPWIVTPLLMFGGLYLSYEGAEKVLEAVLPHAAEAHDSGQPASDGSPREIEATKVASAIRTDFILSAEIMAMILASVPDASLFVQAAVLVSVGLAVTVGVYGAVALIVKADDVGVALAANPQPASSLLGLRAPASEPSPLDRAFRRPAQAVGRGLVKGMPPFLTGLGLVGVVAMLWVGGGILVHGLETFGWATPAHGLARLSHAAEALPAAGGAVAWAAEAMGLAVLGLIAGALSIPIVQWILKPLARLVRPRPAAETPP